jgi:hypothetical protein
MGLTLPAGQNARTPKTNRILGAAFIGLITGTLLFVVAMSGLLLR